MKLDNRNLARALFFKALKEYNEYLAECAEWAEQGYRPHYCRHGVNMWVDYDCACWQCEEYGNYWNDAQEWQFAKGRAQSMNDAGMERVSLWLKMSTMGAPVSDDFSKWLNEPFEKMQRMVDQYA